MAKKLKLTYFEGSECEVTGKYNSSQEEYTFEIDKLVPGDVLYSYFSRAVKFKQKIPTGVIVEIDTIYTINEGKVVYAGPYSLDGNHTWRYKFQIVTE